MTSSNTIHPHLKKAFLVAILMLLVVAIVAITDALIITDYEAAVLRRLAEAARR